MCTRSLSRGKAIRVWCRFPTPFQHRGRVRVELYIWPLSVRASCVTAYMLHTKDTLIAHILLRYGAYVSETGTGNTGRIEHETYKFYSK
jgi:hypothetical protein